MDAGGGVELNAWTLPHGRRWKHWALQFEARYRSCDRFSGHFVGVHAHGEQYNVGGIDGRIHFLGTDARKLKDSRYQRHGRGCVPRLRVDVRPPLESERGKIGLDHSHTRYDHFCNCGRRCGRKLGGDGGEPFLRVLTGCG